jgi:hypothetical protein
MISNFRDFFQFSAKKLAFFSKANAVSKSLAKTSSSWSKKTQIFAPKFSAEIFKKS